MLYREIIAVCFQIHTKQINTLWGQNIEYKAVFSHHQLILFVCCQANWDYKDVAMLKMYKL